MAKKLSYQDFRTLIGNVSEECLGNSDKAQYTIGAYESLIAHVAADLSLAKQLDLARSLGALAERLKSWK